ncbi:MAG: tRNA uridine-5-carboxymethylaminomethyl(34) synthesis GTPase MnmE [Proteobacteria bacterium]|nr:tRNA uridine-5-carboxymethylaminomethyl(34) synthesis GTPase MnmE [Pseudomonadota bacterium]NCA28766.1 tRNA uridine-5-carboxymethylaminomethyl(34) synthesis GTPase MnmE [Pseudomonadota bacterium]
MKTIFASITSPIRSSITIIRISGSQTIECIKQLGVKKEPISHQSFFHKIVFENQEHIIDESIITYFKAPKSFTGEDVVEISIHSSPFIIKSIFAKLLSINNVDLAQAGEFSRRAFLNGKIDLVQAEAIPDLIASETEAQHRQSIQQLQGHLGKIYHEWTKKIIEISAFVEALIDFPDEDLPPEINANIQSTVNDLQNQISNHLNDNKIGQKIKDGLRVAIIGAPNVGKSSLINLLAKNEIAIVSEIAGTTRDTIEAHLEINGMSVIISDTAGIRSSNDLIEQEGIKRAIKKAQNSDLILYIIDATNPIIIPEYIDERTILIINKIDRNPDFSIQKLITNYKIIHQNKFVKISITQKINIKELAYELEKTIEKLYPSTYSPNLTQERYRVALQNCLDSLERFNLENNIELGAENLRICLTEISKITGKISIEDILDLIFSRFCIGK